MEHDATTTLKDRGTCRHLGRTVTLAGTIAAGGSNAPLGVLTSARVQTNPIPQGAAGPRLRAADSGPKFEVAAIKPNRTADNGVRINLQPGGRFTATNATLRALLRFAYQLQDFQFAGGPDWMNSDRFDIVAKADVELSPTLPGTAGPIQLMLRSLLEERFKLTAHHEMRDLPIYALVMARSDRRLGPKLQASAVDCDTIMAAAMVRGISPPPPTPSGRPVCGTRITGGQMMAGGFPLSQLASALSQTVQRMVVDRTGLTGNYDVELVFTPDQMPQGTLATGAPPSAIDPNGPSVFAALQEQLGLKLDSQRGPVDVLVIDSAERPKED